MLINIRKQDYKLPDTHSCLFDDQDCGDHSGYSRNRRGNKEFFSLSRNTISVLLLFLLGTRNAAQQVSARLVLCLMKQMNTLVEPFRVVRRWERQVRYSAHQIFKQYIPDSTTVFSDIPCWCRVQSVLCLFVCSMISYSMLQKLIHELRRGKIT